jgi:tripartite-type tricarboxylate transporter receptor subunit TctC
MTLARRRFLHLAAASAALSAASRNAWALDYPTRPVRIVVGFRAGSATDVDARLIAQPLSERLGEQFIVDDRPGAGGNIAAENVVTAAPDGYSLLLMSVGNAVNATLYRKLNFDIVRDIAPVGATMRTASVMVVNPSVPAKTIPEFIAYAKANAGKINYASGGYGSAPNMAAELFKMMTGVNLVHVPYSSSPMPDLLSGQVQVFFTPLPATISFVRNGKLRALGVTSAARSPALPDVPAIAEFVPGYEADVWHGIGAPTRTPGEIVTKLNQAINAMLADPTIKQRYANLGAEPMPMTPDAFGKFVVAEIGKWAKVIKFAGIKPI